jgi:hypothetical protein
VSAKPVRHDQQRGLASQWRAGSCCTRAEHVPSARRLRTPASGSPRRCFDRAHAPRHVGGHVEEIRCRPHATYVYLQRNTDRRTTTPSTQVTSQTDWITAGRDRAGLWATIGGAVLSSALTLAHARTRSTLQTDRLGTSDTSNTDGMKPSPGSKYMNTGRFQHHTGACAGGVNVFFRTLRPGTEPSRCTTLAPDQP